MEKQLFAEINQEKRKEYLADNADTVEKVSYVKKYTYDQLLELKEKLSKISIDIQSIEDQKKAAMDEFKAALTPLKTEILELISKIKNKSEVIEEDCYKMIDHKAGLVGYYNSVGELVESRPIYPNEKQTSIYSITRKSI